MNLPKRKSARLKEYDYSSPGAYFITICTNQKSHLFGKITNNRMHLNNIGEIVNQEILKIESHYHNIQIDKYVIMPNHIHLIITILACEGINPFPAKKHNIPSIIGSFKAGVTRNVGNAFMHSAKKIWQTSYHDHIIRGKNDYKKIWEYIDTNVTKWESDYFYGTEKEQ